MTYARMRARLTYLRTGARRRLRDLALRDLGDDRFAAREDLARRYLRGDGIEIGPFTFQLRLPPGLRVRYVDRLPRDELVEATREILAVSHLDPQLGKEEFFVILRRV